MDLQKGRHSSTPANVGEYLRKDVKNLREAPRPRFGFESLQKHRLGSYLGKNFFDLYLTLYSPSRTKPGIFQSCS